ncbi:hypothetical protein ABK040_004611 [Willaertia magna]
MIMEINNTLEHYIKAVDNVLNIIFKNILQSINCNITKVLDELNDYLSLFYLYPNFLNENEINNLQVYLNNLYLQLNDDLNNNNLQQKIKKLERIIKFKYFLNKICTTIIFLINLTAEELKRNINNIEIILNVKLNFIICDNGLTVLKFINNDTSLFINYMGHNLNLIFHHFINTLYPLFDSHQILLAASNYIYKYKTIIYKALKYIQKKNIQSIYSEILELLEDNLFYKQFLSKYYINMKYNNTINYMYRYIKEWKQCLKNIQFNEIYLETFNNAKLVSLKEFNKLIMKNTFFFVLYVGLLDNKYVIKIS